MKLMLSKKMVSTLIINHLCYVGIQQIRNINFIQMAIFSKCYVKLINNTKRKVEDS